MEFNGIWKNMETGELIEISSSNSADTFILSFDTDLNSSEIIKILISNSEHALLTQSEKFGRQNISILSADKFKIGNTLFIRE